MYTLLAYQTGENARAQKVLTVANYCAIKMGLKHAEIPANEAFKLNCSPLGGNPVLETPEGHIFETNAIMRFIARKTPKAGLYGKTEFEAALVDGWMDFFNAEFDPLPIYGLIFEGKPLPEDWMPACDTAFGAVEKWLETRTFLVGERITLADICIAFTLQTFYRRTGEGQVLASKYKNLFRLYNTVMHQPQAVEAIKTVGGSFGIPAEGKV